jgi:hypothetical protein
VRWAFTPVSAVERSMNRADEFPQLGPSLNQVTNGKERMRKVVLYELLALDGVAAEPGNGLLEGGDEFDASTRSSRAAEA